MIVRFTIVRRLRLLMRALIWPERFFIVEIAPADTDDLAPFIQALKGDTPAWWSFEKWGVEGITFLAGASEGCRSRLAAELREVTE